MVEGNTKEDRQGKEQKIEQYLEEYRQELDMLMLEQNARVILTDSGGVQKEAYFFGVPCITLRPETEWTETVESGWNVVVGTNQSDIVDAVQTIKPPQARGLDFGGGNAASRIVKILAGPHPDENEIMG